MFGASSFEPREATVLRTATRCFVRQRQPQEDISTENVELFLAPEQVQHSQVMTTRQTAGTLCLANFFCPSLTVV